ncbi:E3 ubiquitin-protein ligase MARCHF6-like isoform X1 [Synchiropus splendidus]|uniref:E3 ubiquitin-protein ligase MARCHF6-like isoform X1 n=1 Tax=Synchiropus splendidus TaxID=270530 RepID=UPI00237D8D2C|nr:E3 ubiquitin-protein ligase MARCHF6-like isoform X1 [Synchiropus splendidus]
MDTAEDGDICRVCRTEGTLDKPLFHPCVCTGSIKFVHQECLLQWLKHSRKEYCEVCSHQFAFAPIYSPDMPSRLPFQDIFSGLAISVGRAIRYWFHYTLVALAWLGVVPLTACRIYKCLFIGSLSSLLTLPLDMLSTQNLTADCLQGCFVVTCTLCAFIGLVWLREQIIHDRDPQWLGQNPLPLVPHRPPAARDQAPRVDNAFDDASDEEEEVDDRPVWGLVADLENHDDILAALDDDDDGDDEEEEEPDEEDDVDFDDEDFNEEWGEQDNINDDGNEGQGLNWNAVEWERVAEDLTWERMLGLDGSLVFLEHVFWVVSLNTVFILVFAFCPYHIGHFSVVGLGLEEYVKASHFDGLLATIMGYVVLAAALMWCHALAALVRFHRFKRLLGVCYIVVKVSLLVVMEIGLFPLICGWWLDICSLEMFDVTLKDRSESFNSTPGTTIFLHWLVGMVYVFYFASFILLLREVLRPGVLWFLRNLNDPDFNPVQEMIHLPIYRHLRRFMLSVVVFGSIVLLMLWLPIRIIKLFSSNFLPYNVMLYSDAPVSELSLELLLLQVILPALLEQGHTRRWMKQLIHAWTYTAGYMLDLHSYLLGDHSEDDDVHVRFRAGRRNENHFHGHHAARHGRLQQRGHADFRPYHPPLNFPLKILLLMVFVCVTLLLASLLCLTVPVCVGRGFMSFWMGSTEVHELYTAVSGLYICWLSIRVASVLLSWMQQDPTVILHKVHEWAFMIVKTVVVAVLLAGVIPLLLGLLFELLVIAPLRIPLDQTPLFNPWQDLALGVLQAKIITAFTLMGPQWWLKTAIEQVYANGLRNLNLVYIVRRLAAPVISVLLLILCTPYIIARGVVPLLCVKQETQTLVERRIYPCLLMVGIMLAVLHFQVRQFRRLYEHIKNDKYLVGQQLVNYERRNIRAASKPSKAST